MYSSMVESIFELMRSDELVEPQVKSDEVEHFILDLLVQCPFCSYVDTSQINLGDHIKEEHVEQLVPSELTDNSHHSVELGANRIFLCPYCTYAVGSISGDKDTSYIVTHVSHCKANPTKKTHGLAKVEFKVSTDQDLVDSILAKKQQGDRYHCNLCGNLVFGSPEALLNHYLDAHSTASLNSLPSDIRQVIEDVVTTRRNNERQEPKLSCLDGEPNTGMQSNQQWSQPVNQTQELESSINAQRPISVDNSKVKREADISNHILGALASTPVPVHIRVLHSDVLESFLITLGELESLLIKMESKKVESNGQYWRLLEYEKEAEERRECIVEQPEPNCKMEPQESESDVEDNEDSLGHSNSSDQPAEEQMYLLSGPKKVSPPSQQYPKEEETADLELHADCKVTTDTHQSSINIMSTSTHQEDTPLLQPEHVIESGWYVHLRDQAGTLGPIDYRTLLIWAQENRLGPNDHLSLQEGVPITAKLIPELNMVAFVQLVTGELYGPINPAAIRVLQSQGLVKWNPDPISKKLDDE